MSHKPIINLSSLKEQVYDYLSDQMKKGNIRPGSTINMEETSERLGVSKTPLREALLRLEIEGFVTILPRRGVIVNKLTLNDIRDYYQVIGALESTALLVAGPLLSGLDINKMIQHNKAMASALDKENFDLYYQKNLAFHDIYINASTNKIIKNTIASLKKRLYDFPRPSEHIQEWEERSIGEHETLTKFIKSGQFQKAADFIRDVHWSFKVQESYIKKYYVLSK